jgi:hypothetical protein
LLNTDLNLDTDPGLAEFGSYPDPDLDLGKSRIYEKKVGKKLSVKKIGKNC